MNISFVMQLAREYIANPNCRPIDWIAGENVTDEEKEKFLSIITDHKNEKDSIGSYNSPYS